VKDIIDLQYIQTEQGKYKNYNSMSKCQNSDLDSSMSQNGHIQFRNKSFFFPIDKYLFILEQNGFKFIQDMIVVRQDNKVSSRDNKVSAAGKIKWATGTINWLAKIKKYLSGICKFIKYLSGGLEGAYCGHYNTKLLNQPETLF